MHDWVLYRTILNRARSAMKTRFVGLARYDAEEGMVRVVALAGMESRTFMRAVNAVSRILPGFDVLGIEFPVIANQHSRESYLEGKTVRAPISEIAKGIVSSTVIELGGRLLGMKHGMVCPITVKQKVVGALVFYLPKPFTEEQRKIGEAFARQTALTWENIEVTMELEQQIAALERKRRLIIDQDPVLQQALTKADGPLSYEDLSINQQTHEVLFDGARIDLTNLEFELLACFMRYPGRPLTREELARQVWGNHRGSASNFVDVTVMHLRRKLEAEERPRLIHAVRGHGYVLHKDGAIEGE